MRLFWFLNLHGVWLAGFLPRIRSEILGKNPANRTSPKELKGPYLMSQANSTVEAPQHAGGQHMLSLIQWTDGGRGFFLLPEIF